MSGFPVTEPPVRHRAPNRRSPSGRVWRHWTARNGQFWFSRGLVVERIWRRLFGVVLSSEVETGGEPLAEPVGVQALPAQSILAARLGLGPRQPAGVTFCCPLAVGVRGVEGRGSNVRR